MEETSSSLENIHMAHLTPRQCLGPEQNTDQSSYLSNHTFQVIFLELKSGVCRHITWLWSVEGVGMWMEVGNFLLTWDPQTEWKWPLVRAQVRIVCST